MKFDIITIFPEIFDSYLNESILKRAQKKNLIKIKIHNLRDFAADRHKKVDDKPYGGGPGMVLKIEPLVKALGSILRISKSKSQIILFSPAGKKFNQKMAAEWAKKHKQLILIAGRYEGVDERVKKVIRNLKLEIIELSVGPYVLTGGELPAMIVIDAVSRHIPGVLGEEESLEEKRLGIGVPVYTRPEVFKWPIRQALLESERPRSRRQGKQKKYRVPKVLLSGNHQKIEEWHRRHQKR